MHEYPMWFNHIGIYTYIYFLCSFSFFFFLSYFMYCGICIYFNKLFIVIFPENGQACIKWRRIYKTYLEKLYIVKRLCGWLKFVCIWTVCFYTASWVWIYYLPATMIGFGGSWSTSCLETKCRCSCFCYCFVF